MGGLYAWFFLYVAVVTGLVMLQGVITTAFWFVRSRLDDAHPDDLPLTAGQFATATAERLGLPVQVLAMVGDHSSIDAFFPSARTVALATHTFVKRDPTCWALAAHELGHALVHLKGRAMTTLLQGARALASGAKGLGLTVLLGNLVFASRELSQLALTSLLVSLSATAVVLVDEAAASWLAMKILREDGRLTPERIRTAWQVLTAAFCTYFADFIGQLLLVLAGRSLNVIALTRSFVPAEPLGAGEAWFVRGLALLVLVVEVGLLWRTLRPKSPPSSLAQAQQRKQRDAVRDFFRGMPVLLLLWWVWDQPMGEWAPVACIFAMMGARVGIAVLLVPFFLCVGVPMAVVLLPVFFYFLAHKEPDHGPNFQATQADAAKASAQKLEDLALAFERAPSRLLVLGRLLELAAPLPLAVLVLVNL